jgi:hypothetical protein
MSSSSSKPVGDPKVLQHGLYKNAWDAENSIKEDYQAWTGKLTDSSFQLSLGLIGANWAAFGGSVKTILSNSWAKSSLGLVIVSLALGLLGTKWMSESLRRRIDYADEDCTRWEKEWEASVGGVSPWPYSQGIDRLGRWLREAKAWLPIVAGALFLIGLFSG